MKKTLLAIALGLFSTASNAQALPSPAVDYDPTVTVGLSYNLSGALSLKNLGFTLKLVTTNEEEKWVGALGASYFPWSEKQFGIDLSAGYNFTDSTLFLGYDFLHQSLQLGGGWTNTKSTPPAPGPL